MVKIREVVSMDFTDLLCDELMDIDEMILLDEIEDITTFVIKIANIRSIFQI